MSRMSDLWLEIEELVYDAIADGCIYDGEVVKYVNDRATLKVDEDVIKGIINSYCEYLDGNPYASYNV